MIHEHESSDDELTPAYAGRLNQRPTPKNKLPDLESPPTSVYRLIHDELLLDGSSRLNLATFVTTWMEPEADLLMAQSFDKNMIDKDEYPQTAEIERRCVNMVANLFNAPVDGDAIGVSTIGSSEAVMLAGLAMKWQWRKRREAAGLPTDRPNMVMGSNVQVVWEKFCRYWDVEPRYVPVTTTRFVVDPDDVMERVDENTIGVIPILGTTFTGEFEPDQGDPRPCGRLQRGARPRHPDPRRCGQWRFRCAVPAPRSRVGLPTSPGEVDQRVRPQVRAHLPRASVSSSGVRRTTCPKTSSSTSTTWAATCRPSR